MLQTPSPIGLTFQTMTDIVSYCGPFEYSNGSLSRVNFPGGYVSGGVAYHYIHDHQGNVRQVVEATTGKVDQENHYYPGGMLFAESTATYFKPGSANNTYRYGGKELLTDEGLNLYRFGARMYDPALLRFITPDPLRHKTPHLSSYLYCAANPVILIDPTGMIFKYNGTDEEIKMLKWYIETLKENRLFSSYFQLIEQSCYEYNIEFGDTDYKGISCPGYYVDNKNTIVINRNNDVVTNYATIIEETFHAYQRIIDRMLKSRIRNNMEYEAKLVKCLIMNDNNENIPGYGGTAIIGMDVNNSFIQKCIPNYCIDIRNTSYTDLSIEYYKNGEYFVQQQPTSQPIQYLEKNLYFSTFLYNLLLQASPED